MEIKEIEKLQFKFKINPEYARIAEKVPLSVKEYQDLKENIRQNGQLDSIKLNKEGQILDGHHRNKICQELGIEPKTETLHFENKYLEKLFVININRDRRQLNEFGGIELALEAKPVYELMVKQNMSLGGKGVPIGTPFGRIDQRIADDAHTSKNKVWMVEYILQNAKSEDIKRLKEGRARISKVYKFIRRQISYDARLQQAIKDAKNFPLQNDMYELHQGDMREKALQDIIPDESIQAIVTDPPYDEERLPLCGEAVKLYEKKMKMGGCFAALTGGYALSKIIRIIEDNCSLKWQWDIVLKHSGSSEIIRGMQVKHKTWVLYYKGDKPTIHGPMPTLSESKDPDKTSDLWAQSPEDARPLIQYLTVPGEIILDTMMGTGTFGIPAIEMGRRFIGIEEKTDKFTIARNQIDAAYRKYKELFETRRKNFDFSIT